MTAIISQSDENSVHGSSPLLSPDGSAREKNVSNNELYNSDM